MSSQNTQYQVQPLTDFLNQTVGIQSQSVVTTSIYPYSPSPSSSSSSSSNSSDNSTNYQITLSGTGFSNLLSSPDTWVLFCNNSNPSYVEMEIYNNNVYSDSTITFELSSQLQSLFSNPMYQDINYYVVIAYLYNDVQYYSAPNDLVCYYVPSTTL
jgi:hypothetical protein